MFDFMDAVGGAVRPPPMNVYRGATALRKGPATCPPEDEEGPATSPPDDQYDEEGPATSPPEDQPPSGGRGTRRDENNLSDFKIAQLAMIWDHGSEGPRSPGASLQARDASADAVEKEYEKEFFALRSCGHSLDKIRQTANFGPDQMASGAHSELARGAETYSAGRYHPVVPEAMRLKRLDPFSGPSPSWCDVSNFIEWEQVLARAPDMILADAHELGSVPDLMARGDALEILRINFRAISRKGTSCRHVEITEADVEANAAARERGGIAATLRHRSDDVGAAFETRTRGAERRRAPGGLALVKAPHDLCCAGGGGGSGGGEEPEGADGDAKSPCIDEPTHAGEGVGD